MSAQFTPGPWKAYDYGNVWYVATPSLRIGSIDTNHEANANLIAAAPELYEVLADARDVLAGMDDDEINEELLPRLSAALAKARGEQ